MPLNKNLVLQVKQMFDVDQDVRMQAMANNILREPLVDFFS